MKRQMSDTETLAALKDLATRGDPEATHLAADAVLCAFIRNQGYPDIAEAFEAIERWYA